MNIQQNPNSLIPVGQLVSQSWKLFVNRLPSFLKLVFFQFCVSLSIVALIGGGYWLYKFLPAINNRDLYIVLYSLVALVLIVFLYILKLRIQISTMYVPTTLVQKTFGEYFWLSKGKAISFFFLSLLQLLIIFGGAVLLIIPGIIFAIGIAFSNWVFVVEGKSGFDAIYQSLRYAYKRKWALLLRGLVLSIAVGIVAAISKYLNTGSEIVNIVISTIISVFVSGYALCYGYLLFRSAVETHHTNYHPRMGVVKFISVVGLVVIIAAPVFVLYVLLKNYI